MLAMLLAAGSGINWNAPQSISLSQNTGDYEMKSGGDPVSGKIVGTKTSPVGGRANAVYGECRLTTEPGTGIGRLVYGIDGDDLVLAGNRDYQVQGTVEINTSPVAGDPPNYGVEVRCYRDTDATDLIEAVEIDSWSDAGSNDREKNYDETVQFPSGTKYIELTNWFEVTDDNSSGPEIYTYDVTIDLVT